MHNARYRIKGGKEGGEVRGEERWIRKGVRGRLGKA